MKALLRYVKLGVIVAISGIYATPAFADTQFPQELSKMVMPSEGGSLPEDLAFVDENGNEVAFNSLKGQVVLVNLWATWCVPCVKEMPELDQLAVEMADKPFRVLALSQDRGGADAVREFFETNGIENLDIVLDPRGAIARQMGARGLPTSFVYDAKGDLRGKLEGIARWDAPEVITYFDQLIDQTS
ncbi:TlpA disulfide reductase family protein [Thalassospira sp.]|uniref:TlpA disulfide reductase family protein n=1 Tax=Thalassospira sp. TaxID=1912094 RepID=UPI000796EF08|nr:TlpA disulfide reductase family protein [Thalassospira sp.]KXJ54115.1 MAG: thiol:disulfide interchange protein [Thalassospira sp. Nap_22]MBO6579581.1 TlpA family protein disulfide reductase [Thalassospira sp.]MBO6802108.1 TlpA family protein disulfide reductase [Thalassospira sp.]MBO6817432.1 TlpA family protein disulfide reductase [Thalassospira sp.]